jgi:hypothetical protein
MISICQYLKLNQIKRKAFGKNKLPPGGAPFAEIEKTCTTDRRRQNAYIE